MNRPRSPAELDLIDQLEKLIVKLDEGDSDGEIMREMERLLAIIKQWRLTGSGEQ